MSTALQVYPGDQQNAVAVAVRRPVALLRPIAAPRELLEAQEAARTLVQEVLKPGRDYGTVPYVDKPFLFKAGAERVALGFGCYYGPPRIVEREIDHDRVMTWTKKVRGTEKSGQSVGFYRYVIAVPVFSRETGECIAEGMGSCSTTESKYCDRPRELENTVLKMAQKRAMVAACLIAFGLSDQFTQDEDVVKESLDAAETEEGGAPAATGPAFTCPKCGGHECWDNRAENAQRVKDGKKPRPDLKCKTRDCDGVVWHYEEPAAAETLEAPAETAPAPAAAKPAREKPLPQMTGFETYAGKPLGAIPPDVLAAIEDKLAKRKVVPAALLAGVRAVLAESQEWRTLVEEPAKAAAAQPVTMTPGRVQDALDLTPRERAALATPSDDLPF